MSAQTPTTEQIRGGWDRIAARFDEIGIPFSLRLAQDILDTIGLRPPFSGGGFVSLQMPERAADKASPATAGRCT
ncbi:MAG: hypothetical protein M3O70_01990 [Actinomycetota bacterium]|nr:hypothetical protein [Actinomycetota bacterium]